MHFSMRWGLVGVFFDRLSKRCDKWQIKHGVLYALKLSPRELDLVEAATEALPLHEGAYPAPFA